MWRWTHWGVSLQALTDSGPLGSLSPDPHRTAATGESLSSPSQDSGHCGVSSRPSQDSGHWGVSLQALTGQRPLWSLSPDPHRTAATGESLSRPSGQRPTVESLSRPSQDSGHCGVSLQTLTGQRPTGESLSRPSQDSGPLGSLSPGPHRTAAHWGVSLQALTGQRPTVESLSRPSQDSGPLGSLSPGPHRTAAPWGVSLQALTGQRPTVESLSRPSQDSGPLWSLSPGPHRTAAHWGVSLQALTGQRPLGVSLQALTGQWPTGESLSRPSQDSGPLGSLSPGPHRTVAHWGVSLQALTGQRPLGSLSPGPHRTAAHCGVSLTCYVSLTDFRSDDSIKQDKERDEDDVEIVSYELKKDGIVSQYGKNHTEEEKKLMKGNMFQMSKWFFDTPGVVNSSQLINLLTQDELFRVIQKGLIKPRPFILPPNQVMFVSGLGRLDYIQGEKSIVVTVHTSSMLPVHIVKCEEADTFYEENVGTDILGVPLGDGERLSALPPLVGKEYYLNAIDMKTASADIQLSSLGWVSFCIPRGLTVGIKAYVPGGKGCSIREPALLPNAKVFRGPRIRGTAMYKLPKPVS
ncbi:hypothetical protein ScPMuIL_002214 [Solemya velum]